VTAVIGFYKPAASYAHLVEFGTAHSPPQPFMRPAIGLKAHDAIAVIGHQLWAGLDAEAKKAKK
jgi:HK97 gp10 family phage protein